MDEFIYSRLTPHSPIAKVKLELTRLGSINEVQVMKALNKFLCAAGAALAFAAAATAADATVYIGVSTNGGASITQVASGADSALYSGSQGVFNINLVSGANGINPVLLGSTTNNTTSTGAGSIDIYVSGTDFSTTEQQFLSGFTTNFLPTGWTVTETNYVDTSNTLTWGGTVVGQTTFTGAPGLQTASVFNPTVSGPFSVTQRYTITATGSGQQLSTINLAAVPEPGVWALMLLGFGGVGAMLRTNRRRALAFA